MSNIFDKAIAAVAPVHAAKRAAARKALQVYDIGHGIGYGSGYGNYGANRRKKNLIGWYSRSGSAKEDIEDNLDVLRQRSRDAYMGIPVATAALKSFRTNVIAGGLMPTPQLDGEVLHLSDEQMEAKQKQILREFSLWADTSDCDAGRVDNFYKLQKLAYLSYLMNGDAFVLMPEMETVSRDNPYSLRLMLVEADRVCSPDMQDRLTPCTVYGHSVYQIVQGIETDELGTVVAYWICNHHPHSLYAIPGKLEWHRVEAIGAESGRKNVLHLMNRERIGQRRGVPLLAPVLEALKGLGDYQDAEIQAAVVSSLFTVFVKKENASDGRPFAEMLPPDVMIDSADQSTLELAPAAIVDLNPGEDVAFADPKHPSSGFDTFSDAVIKQVCAALEIPMEVMQKQFTTSYSAARGALNEFWRTCTMERDEFIDDFCQPVYETWLAEAVALGRIQAPGYFNDPVVRKAYSCCRWSGPARTNLNPVQEVQAAQLRVQEGFSTAAEETAQMTGGDYTRNIRQRLIEAKQKRDVDEIAGYVQTQMGYVQLENNDGGGGEQD